MGLGGILVYVSKSRIKTSLVSDSITYTSEKGHKQLVPTQNERVKRELHYRMCHKLRKCELVLVRALLYGC